MPRAFKWLCFTVLCIYDVSSNMLCASFKSLFPFTNCKTKQMFL